MADIAQADYGIYFVKDGKLEEDSGDFNLDPVLETCFSRICAELCINIAIANQPIFLKNPRTIILVDSLAGRLDRICFDTSFLGYSVGNMQIELPDFSWKKADDSLDTNITETLWFGLPVIVKQEYAAQLLKNNLLLLFNLGDLVANLGSDKSGEILLQIFDKAKEFFIFDESGAIKKPENYNCLRPMYCQAAKAQEKEILCREWPFVLASNKQLRSNTLLAKLITERVTMQTMLTSLRKMAEIQCDLADDQDSLDKIPSEHQLKEDIEKIFLLPEVEGVTTTKSGNLIVDLKGLVIGLKIDSTTRWFGGLRVIFDFRHFSINVLNNSMRIKLGDCFEEVTSTGQKIVSQYWVEHPHVIGLDFTLDGRKKTIARPCFGNLEPALNELMLNHEYFRLVELVIKFLGQVNEEDRLALKYAQMFPKIDASELQEVDSI